MAARREHLAHNTCSLQDMAVLTVRMATKGGPSPFGGSLDVGVVAQQQLQHGDVAAHGRPVDRSVPLVWPPRAVGERI
jgi:hypothetical protein